MNQLKNEDRRPSSIRDPIPEEIVNFQPRRPFDLDKRTFIKKIRGARRGVSGGPSGMTADYLKVLLDDSSIDLLFELALELARAELPSPIMAILRLGRINCIS